MTRFLLMAFGAALLAAAALGESAPVSGIQAADVDAAVVARVEVDTDGVGAPSD